MGMTPVKQGFTGQAEEGAGMTPVKQGFTEQAEKKRG